MTFEVALRAAVILVAAGLLARALGRAAAATRHLVWHAAVVAVLAAPVAALIVPSIALPRFEAAHRLARAAAHALAPRTALPARSDALEDGAAAALPAHARLDARDPIAWLTAWAPRVWLGGSVLAALWFALGYLAAALGARRGAAAPAAWQQEVNALCARARVAADVRVRVHATETSPVVLGLRRPTILLPPSAVSWAADRRRAVLLHELAHVRRGDLRVQALAHAACALYWFNPLIWIAAAALRRERERACDDDVLRLGTPPSAYASHLLELTRGLCSPRPAGAVLAMARPSEIEARVCAVLDARRGRGPAAGTRWAVASLIGAISVAALALSPAQPAAAAPARGSAQGFVLVDEAARGTGASTDVRGRIARLQSALRDGDRGVRERAALAIGLISSAEAIDPLLAALRDREAGVREKAAIGLALRHDRRVVDALIAALHDPDAHVREKAAVALGTSGDARAVTPLESALSDPDAHVREKAAAALLLLPRSPDETQAAAVRDALGALVGGLLARAR